MEAASLLMSMTARGQRCSHRAQQLAARGASLHGGLPVL